MRVLHISTYDKGGAAISCIRLHQQLLEAGVDSHLLTIRKSRGDLKNHYSLAADMAPKGLVQRFKYRLRHRRYAQKKQGLLAGLPKISGLFSLPFSPYDLAVHPAYQQADIIQLHWVAGMIDYPTWASQNTKPTVWTLHDMNPITGGHHYETGYDAKAYHSIHDQMWQVKNQALQGQKISVCAPSRWLHKLAAESKLMGAFPQYYIPYSMPTEAFKNYPKMLAREVFGLPKDKKVLLFVANTLSEDRKGFHLLQAALQQLQNEDMALAVIGQHTEGLAGLDQVYPLGWIQDEKLMALAYASADYFVMPSLEDNLPNTVLESICSGTPVIGFASGGIPDMIFEGLNGFLCKAPTTKDLIEGIKRGLTTPLKMSREQIRHDAVERYHESIAPQRYVQLYQDILS